MIGDTTYKPRPVWTTIHYDITLTSLWPRWRLKSPASRLFTQSFIQTQIKENIKAPRHWPLCGEFTGTGEFPAQRASYAENVSIWWRHHDMLRPPVIPRRHICPYWQISESILACKTRAGLVQSPRGLVQSRICHGWGLLNQFPSLVNLYSFLNYENTDLFHIKSIFDSGQFWKYL